MARLHSRILWLLVLVGHVVGACGWSWFMPGGFPVAHARFWVNRALPLLLIIAIIATLWAARKSRMAVVRETLLTLAVMWLSAAITAAVLFRESRALVWIVPLAISIVVVIAAMDHKLRSKQLSRLGFGAMAFGAIVGVFLPWSQRGPVPDTRPLLTEMPSLSVDRFADSPRVISLNDVVRVQSSDGLVTLQRGRTVMYVQPMLTFVSRSPDRCWTVFARRDDRVGALRQLTGLRFDQSEFNATYADSEQHALTVRLNDAGNGVESEAFARLVTPVHSHLNSLAEITIAGHKRLFISFSPCPAERVEVKPMGYPVGDPARVAFVSEDGIFRVVEARSGEKGPYRELARGPLSRSQPLEMVFYDETTPIGRVILLDWAAQASTDLSPTAGWGLPMNAIEFSLTSDRPSSPASIFITLASTSVGRGWDSVSHAAGVYRNRMSVQLLSE